AARVWRGRPRRHHTASRGPDVPGFCYLLIPHLHSAVVLLYVCKRIPDGDGCPLSDRSTDHCSTFGSCLYGPHAVLHRAAGSQEDACCGNAGMGGAVFLLRFAAVPAHRGGPVSPWGLL